jgi:hypothetical protein
VVSEVLREESHSVRGKTIALHEHYAQLLEHSTAAMEQLGQLIPLPPAERHQAESQMFTRGKDAR